MSAFMKIIFGPLLVRWKDERRIEISCLINITLPSVFVGGGGGGGDLVVYCEGTSIIALHDRI